LLERCLEHIERLEPQVRAFVRLDIEGARAAADAAAERWRRGQPLSVVDAMPVAVKDCLDVQGWPTEVNCALFKDRIADIDAAHVDCPAPPRCDRARQDHDHRADHGGPAAHLQSLGPDAHPRRLLGRLGGGGGRTAGPTLRRAHRRLSSQELG
jgi:hypothetical protein